MGSVRQVRSPTLDELPRGSAERVLRQAATWLLPGSAEIDALVDRAQASLLVGWAQSTRLLGPVLVAVDAGALDLPSDLLEEAVAGHLDSMRWCIQLELRLLEVIEWFDAVGGVEFLVIKGPAVAHLDELDASMRSFADLDFLIRGDDFDRALAAMVANGAVRRVPERRPGFDRRFVKSVGLLCPDQVELDVHRTLCLGAHGLRVPLDDLFVQAVEFDIGGRRVLAPTRVHRALHGAYHAMVGAPAPALRTLRDLAGYLTSPDLAPEVVVPEADRWGGTTVLAEAVRATFDSLPFDAPAWREWLDGFEVDPAELDIIESTRYETTWPVEWSTIRELGWYDRGAFLWAVAFPSSDELAERGLSRRQRLARGVRAVAPELRSRLGGHGR
jgi:nitrogen fixation protein